MIFGVASVDGIWIRPDVMSMVMIELLQIEVRDDSWKAATFDLDRGPEFAISDIVLCNNSVQRSSPKGNIKTLYVCK